MKRYLIPLILVSCIYSAVAAEKPLVVIMPLDTAGPRDVMSSRMVRDHLYNILRTSGIVSLVEAGSLEDQMNRFGVKGEAAQLGFAGSIGASLVVAGSVEERSGSIVLVIRAFGFGVPHNGREIYRYRAVIPLRRTYAARDYSYIFEEHAGHFIAGMYRAWRHPVRAVRAEAGLVFPGVPDGWYDLIPGGGGSGIAGHQVLVRGDVMMDHRGGPVPAEGDILLVGHDREADFLDEFYYGRKRELVLGTGGIEKTLWAVLLTPPAAAAMPVVAPVLGYYRSGDWEGLGLWTVNAAPWLFLEGRGFLRDPESRRDKHRTVTVTSRADRAFAWYFGTAGGAALFVDAFAHSSLDEAADYNGRKDYMGSTATAVYLSLVTGGGGHFYKGHRLWGYLFFHVDNGLLYGTLRSFLPEQRYTGSGYETRDINRVHAALWCSALAAVKTVEIIHMLHIRDRITNGNIQEHVFEPLFTMDERGNMIAGARASLSF